MYIFSQQECDEYGVPERLNDPFRYYPHPLVSHAAEIVRSQMGNLPEDVLNSLMGGKMLGVLIIKTVEGKIGFLKGISGLAGGRNNIPGFVPPVFDITDPDGFFKEGEAQLNQINRNISQLLHSEKYLSAKKALTDALATRETQLLEAKQLIAKNKAERKDIRAHLERHSNNGQAQALEDFANEILVRKGQTMEGLHALAREVHAMEAMEAMEALNKESSFQKAEYRRLKAKLDAEVAKAEENFKTIEAEIEALKEVRKIKSEALQERLFKAYIVHNSAGEAASIMDIFAAKGLIPPGGTGDCAGVKLFEYAYLHSLTPLALGEFWFGAPLVASTRLNHRFYPSCTAKCGPVLEWMTSRKALSELMGACPTLKILYEDNDLIAVEKPAGHPSVPGLISGLENVLDALKRQYLQGQELYPVHRLDMDTSGVLIFAKSPVVQSLMMKKFEQGLVKKTYIGIIEGELDHNLIATEGTIELPITPDFTDRPRQKAGIGKPSTTQYKLLGTRKIDNKTLSIVEFHPLSGRTHQIRIHAANPLGLGSPLLGDTLYGGTDPEFYKLPRRLYLHADNITFDHPTTSDPLSIKSQR